MRPARFVTLCFLYSGLVLSTQYAVFYRFRLELGSLAQLGVALSVLAVGGVRLRYPEEERGTPAEYGLFTYGMLLLSALLTAIFLARLVVA